MHLILKTCGIFSPNEFGKDFANCFNNIIFKVVGAYRPSVGDRLLAVDRLGVVRLGALGVRLIELNRELPHQNAFAE